MGRFYFELILKSFLRLLSTARTKIRVRIAVQHQDVLIVTDLRLHYSENDENKSYIIVIDNFYVIVHAIEREM